MIVTSRKEVNGRQIIFRIWGGRRLDENEDGSLVFTLSREDSTDIALQVWAEWNMSSSKKSFEKWLYDEHKKAVEKRVKEEYGKANQHK